MLTREETARRARAYFDADGYNCAEAVSKALAESFGAESPLIPRVATGFGGGLGRSLQVCGAVSGAVIGLGLLFGRDKPGPTASRRPYWYSTALTSAFLKEHGALRCPELLGFNLNDEASFKAFNQARGTKCNAYVEYAAATAWDIAQSEAKSKEEKK